MLSIAELGRWAFKHRGLLFPVAVMLFLIPSPSLVENEAAIGMVGIATVMIGQAIRIGTIGLDYIIRGGKDHLPYADRLVTTGIYAHVRNPMYLGNAFLLAGMAVATNSWVFVIVGVPLAVVVHALMIIAEEDFLARKFGAQYDDYRSHIPRLVPVLYGLATTLGSYRFHWRRVADKEYAKPIDWVSGAAIVVMVNLWRSDLHLHHPWFFSFLIFLVVARLILWSRYLTVAYRSASNA